MSSVSPMRDIGKFIDVTLFEGYDEVAWDAAIASLPVCTESDEEIMARIVGKAREMWNS